MKKLYIETYGCQMNVADTEVVFSILGKEGYERTEEMADADVILAKGQGNYESLCGRGRHIFYSFLCKCELFTTRFQVPPLTGLFIEET